MMVGWGSGRFGVKCLVVPMPCFASLLRSLLCLPVTISTLALSSLSPARRRCSGRLVSFRFLLFCCCSYCCC
uniref:Putative secreted protein n=1 Tax=Anopheles marajoara TaxID=58244 RepID=A0A2M4CEC4_9DIPT